MHRLAERWPYVATAVLTASLVPDVSNHQKMLLCMLFKGAQEAGIFHVLRGNNLIPLSFPRTLEEPFGDMRRGWGDG